MAKIECSFGIDKQTPWGVPFILLLTVPIQFQNPHMETCQHTINISYTRMTGMKKNIDCVQNQQELMHSDKSMLM